MKATPAIARGFTGCGEFNISSFLPKQAVASCRRAGSRCVSWRVRMAMLLLFIVRFIADHFSIPIMLLDGAA